MIERQTTTHIVSNGVANVTETTGEAVRRRITGVDWENVLLKGLFAAVMLAVVTFFLMVATFFSYLIIVMVQGLF